MLSDTYDVYVATTLSVKLVGLNPVGGATSPLLFTWQELGYATDGTTPSTPLSFPPQPPPPGGDGGIQTSADLMADDRHLSVTSGLLSGLQPSSRLATSWPLRVVAPGGGMQAGHRVACAMPYDMLSLGRGSVEETFGALQLQAARRGC